jgi:4-carboxymuconolactone decarboxylase
MKQIRTLALTLLLAGIAASLSTRGSSEQAGANATAASAATQFPKDVYANTGNRRPAIKRGDLDDAGKKLFDARGPNADSFGPGGVRLYSLPVADHMAAVNDYLRNKSGLDPRLVQLAILVTAREADSEYVWTAHEPQGLKAGLSPEVIDVVKYRKPTAGLAEKDAAIIDLGREDLQKHHVSSATFARAQGLFSKKELVEYAALMGDYAATTTLLNTFDQHVRPADKPLLPIP